MYVDSEGVILRNTKTVHNRRMILIFSKKYGKISAGTSISEKGKSKSTLAMRPFTYGKYEMYKNRDNYNINGAETIRSYYKIGEDIDKFMQASYVLEFTDKLLPENIPQPRLFNLLIEYLDALEKRTKKYSTLLIAYQLKAIKEMGYMPELNKCVLCGTEENLRFLDIKNGGLICSDCVSKITASNNDSLIYPVDLGIINILNYFNKNSLKSLEKLALEDKSLKILREIINNYAKYHLDISNLKSEGFLIDE